LTDLAFGNADLDAFSGPDSTSVGNLVRAGRGVRLENVTVMYVPLPGTASLLALAGIAASHRRRR
jgi:hypothetical protein